MNKNTEENIQALEDGKYTHLIEPLKHFERGVVLAKVCAMDGYEIWSAAPYRMSELGDFALGKDFYQLTNESQVEVLTIILAYIVTQNGSFEGVDPDKFIVLSRRYFNALRRRNQ